MKRISPLAERIILTLAVLLPTMVELLDGGSSIFQIMNIFWIETSVIMVFAIPRMLIARRLAPGNAELADKTLKGVLLVVSSVIFLVFMLFSFAFIVHLLKGDDDLKALGRGFSFELYLLGLLHALSFMKYLIDRKYRLASVTGQLSVPFFRLFMMLVPIVLYMHLEKEELPISKVLLAFILFVGIRLLFETLIIVIGSRNKKPSIEEGF